MAAILIACFFLFAPAPPTKQTPSTKALRPPKDAPQLKNPAPTKEPVPAKSRPLSDWLAEIESPDRELLFAAVQALESLGAEARAGVPELIKIVERDKNPARLAAIEIMGTIGPDSAAAIPVLVKSLAHSDFHTQYFALRTLAKIGPESKVAIPEIVRVLKSGAASTRRNAAATLGELGDASGEVAISALTEALSDKLFPVREQVALALGKLGVRSRPALPKLKELAIDRSKSTRVAASYAAWQISGDIEFTLPILLEEMRGHDNPMEAVRTIALIGKSAKAAVQPLIALLHDDEPELRLLSAQALEAIGPDALAAKSSLESLLNDQEQDVRESAASALNAITGKPK